MKAHPHQHGFSLTELLIAMTLGVMLVATMMKLYGQVVRARNTGESLASIEERAAFALAELERDILLAGFWGLHSDGSRITTDAVNTIHCSGNNVSAWALQLQLPVATTQNLPCTPAGSHAPDSDVLIIRRASADISAARIGTVQLESSFDRSDVFSNGNPPGLAANSQVHDLRVHVWYVDTHSSEPGMPALRRMTLVHGSTMQNQEIMPGVENLQFSFGVDRDGDQAADGLLSAVELRAQATAPRIVSVQLQLTVRSGIYEPGVAAADGYRRTQIRRLLKLRNPEPV